MLQLEKNKTYLLACSGGPDSMALFNMLYQEHFNFAVALVNYHKRKVSDDEEEMVRNYALERNIDFYSLSLFKEDNIGNFQAWARRKRYDFFVKLTKEHLFDGVVVAHHLDDLLETYIFQKKRGGIYDFYSLKEISSYKNVAIFRPLLNFKKKELLLYCKENNVPYSIDESNLKNNYSRNIIRHTIVEKLTNQEIALYLKEINDLNSKLQQEDKIINDFLKQDKYYIKDFLNLEECVQKRLIYKLLKQNNLLISGKEINNIILFIKANNHNQYKIKNYFIYCNYGYFELVSLHKITYEINLNKPYIIDNDLFYFDLKNYPETFFIKEDSYPLKIKHPQKDEYVLIGKIKKKINRLYIDEKIPLKLRDIWPCIYNKEGKIIFFPRTNCIKKDNSLIFKLKVK